jgi:hypothetical protein
MGVDDWLLLICDLRLAIGQETNPEKRNSKTETG